MYKVLETKKLFEHKRISILEDEIEYPSGEKSSYLRFEHKNNAAQVIAVREDGKICVTKEYFHGCKLELFGFPGGLIELTEDPLDGARRELLEETGINAEKFECIGTSYVFPRRTKELAYFFIATDLSFQKPNRESSEEGIEILWMSAEEIERLISEDKFQHIYALAHWSLFRNNSPRLMPVEERPL